MTKVKPIDAYQVSSQKTDGDIIVYELKGRMREGRIIMYPIIDKKLMRREM